MNERHVRPMVFLTVTVAGVVFLASLGGILIEGLYRDNAFVESTWLGSDIVNVVLAVPLLLLALYRAIRGSNRAALLLFGVLDTLLYGYAFYLFGAAFNRFFMLYAAAVALSWWALLYGLTGLDVRKIRSCFREGAWVKPVAGWMLFVGLGLAAVYVSQWFGFVSSGRVPDIISKTQHPTNVVLGLDLTMVIPFFVVGAIWLWQRRPWGFVVASIMNVKGTVYMIGLCASTFTAYRAGTIDNLGELAIWGTIGGGCLAASAVLLLAMGSGDGRADERPVMGSPA